MSVDSYAFKYNLIENNIYRVKYSIITNNNLQISTVNYEITMSSIPGFELPIELKPELDYENGRVKISIYPTVADTNLNGTFIFSRCSSKDNFSTWEIS